MSVSSVWSGISCGLLFGLTGEPGLGGLILEDFGDVAGLPLTGAELGDGVLFALAAVEDLEDVAAALGGDAPGIEVLGDGVVVRPSCVVVTLEAGIRHKRCSRWSDDQTKHGGKKDEVDYNTT